MMRKKILAGLSIVLAIPAVAVVLLFCLAAAIWLPCDLHPYDEIAKISVDGNRSVSIYVQTCWEAQRGVHYDAHEWGKTIVPSTWLMADSGFDQYHFRVISAENQSLVGIFDASKPIDDLFIVVNFKTGDSWPNVPLSNEARLKAIDAFERLRRENPDLPVSKRFSP